MKLSKYVALAKRESFCRVIHVKESGIWMGLRGAFYRATELPDICGTDQAKAVLDIPDKAFEKVFFEETEAESESNIYGVDMTPGAPKAPGEAGPLARRPALRGGGVQDVG